MLFISEEERKEVKEIKARIEEELNNTILNLELKCSVVSSSHVNISDLAKKLKCNEGLLILELQNNLKEKRYNVYLEQKGKNTWLTISNSFEVYGNEYDTIEILGKYEETVRYNNYEEYEKTVFIARFSNRDEFRKQKVEQAYMEEKIDYIRCYNSNSNSIPMTERQHEILIDILKKLSYGAMIFTENEMQKLEKNNIFLDKEKFKIRII